MNLPRCKTCLGRGWGYKKGDPTRHPCEDCKGTGRRMPEKKTLIGYGAPKIGPRKRAKMAQVREYKLEYCTHFGEGSPEDNEPSAFCQSCGDVVGITRSEFSHKIPAGMGGAGDIGGQVSDQNGTYSCKCCHAFIEQDRPAFEEHQESKANISNGQRVEFSTEAKARLKAFRQKWYNNPKL